MLVYCMKCKEKTESAGQELVKMKNGKDREASVCAVCGCKKSRMVSSK